MLGSCRVTEFAKTRIETLLRNEPVHPDIAKSVLQSAAFNGDEAVFDWLIRRFETADSEHDRTNILYALGCFRDPGVLSRVRRFILANVPPRNQSIPVSAMAENPAAADGLWEWYTDNRKIFAGFHPLIHERVFAAIVPVNSRLTAAAVQSWLSENQIKINPDVVTLTLERMIVNQRLRQKMNQ
jgi:hypothetical protein